MNIRTMLTEIISAKQGKLIETAFELFQKHGFQRVTIEEICSKAEVSKVTFYRYFSGKDELILFIIRFLIRDIARDMENIINSNISIKDKFYKVTILKQKFVSEIGEEFMQSIFTLPAASQYFTELRQNMWQKIRILLKSEQEKGNINPRLDIDKSIRFLTEINYLYYEKRLSAIYESFEEMVDQINEMIVMGLISRDKE